MHGASRRSASSGTGIEMGFLFFIVFFKLQFYRSLDSMAILNITFLINHYILVLPHGFMNKYTSLG